jgi:hypothetical protein
MGGIADSSNNDNELARITGAITQISLRIQIQGGKCIPRRIDSRDWIEMYRI